MRLCISCKGLPLPAQCSSLLRLLAHAVYSHAVKDCRRIIATTRNIDVLGCNCCNIRTEPSQEDRLRKAAHCLVPEMSWFDTHGLLRLGIPEGPRAFYNGNFCPESKRTHSLCCGSCPVRSVCVSTLRISNGHRAGDPCRSVWT